MGSLLHLLVLLLHLGRSILLVLFLLGHRLFCKRQFPVGFFHKFALLLQQFLVVLHLLKPDDDSSGIVEHVGVALPALQPLPYQAKAVLVPCKPLLQAYCRRCQPCVLCGHGSLLVLQQQKSSFRLFSIRHPCPWLSREVVVGDVGRFPQVILPLHGFFHPPHHRCLLFDVANHLLAIIEPLFFCLQIIEHSPVGGNLFLHSRFLRLLFHPLLLSEEGDVGHQLLAMFVFRLFLAFDFKNLLPQFGIQPCLREFLQDGRLVLPRGLQELGELPLGKHGCPAELVEVEAHDPHHLGKSLAFFFHMSGVEVGERVDGVVEFPVGSSIFPSDGPLRQVVDLISFEIQFRPALSRSPSEELPLVVEWDEIFGKFVSLLRYVLPLFGIVVVGEPDIFLRRLAESRRVVVKREADGVEDGCLPRPRGSGDEKEWFVAQHLSLKIHLGILYRGQVVNAYFLYFHLAFSSSIMSMVCCNMVM